MKAGILLTVLLILFTFNGFSRVWKVTNSYYTFTPQTITVNQGDTVDFEITSGHDVVEVSQQTWNSNGNTTLSEGFKLPFGGGILLTDNLTTGTHYYVCTPHASMGMKATIVVQNLTPVVDTRLQSAFGVYPNPVKNFVTIKSSVKGEVFKIISLTTGKQVLVGKLDDETSVVDLSELASGLYFIQLGSNTKQTLKLIKN